MVLETATSTPRMCETRHSNRVRCCIHPRPRPTSRVNAGELRLTTLRRACAKLPLFIIVVVPRSSPCPHIGHGTGCIQNEMFLLSQRRAKAVGSSGQPCVSHVERASGGQLPVWGEGAPKRHVENNKKASEGERDTGGGRLRGRHLPFSPPPLFFSRNTQTCRNTFLCLLLCSLASL